MTRDKLLIGVWGYDFDGETRTVDVHIARIRSKLGTYKNYITNRSGYGYIFNSQV